MVKERTSAGHYLSPQKTDRQPLASLDAEMQSPQKAADQQATGVPLNLAAQPQPVFGKASPLRTSLPNKYNDSVAFVPRQRTAAPAFKPVRPLATSVAQSSQPSQQPQQVGLLPASVPPAQPQFYVPGQRPIPVQPVATYQHDVDLSHQLPAARSLYQIGKPMNPPTYTTQPHPQPTFSSLGPKTTYESFFQPQATPRNIVDLTRTDDDQFDPDAALRERDSAFGSADPYMYVDSAQASENIKALLEGAFEDEDDKPKTRLRKRAKKVEKEEKDEANTLADKLAKLEVKVKKEATAKAVADADAEQEEEDEEDGTVEGLSVKLLPHQVEGVAWMIEKEIGLSKTKGVLPKGGILADDMGLGKTVQSVALLLTNPRPAPGAKPEHPKQQLPGKDVGKGTLVVAPLALIKQWEAEIKSKVEKSHALKVLVHHGQSRTKSPLELKKYDVVITTYQILSSEHAGSNMTAPDGVKVGCFGVHWYRIILDEAHSIKNRNAKSTQACYALNAWSRWCLTGTPMQNNLDELQSLIHFLQIKPYSEMPQWKHQITGPMKNGRGGIAIQRLQIFLRAVMKRRTKDILKKEGALNFGGKADKEGEEKKSGMQIVKRDVLTVECEFDAGEREFYDRLQARAEKRLKDMMSDGHKADYIGALVLLLRLRQACNHPRLLEAAMNKDKDALTIGQGVGNGNLIPRKTNKVESDEMDDLAAFMGGVSVKTKHCDVCQVELSPAEAGDGAVRCGECEADLLMAKKSNRSKKSKPTKVKKEEKQPAARRKRRVLDDSDDGEEGEGEWIGKEPEQHIDLGKAGGTDDEDAEGGGDILGSIDSATDDEDEDSPPHARRSRRTAKHEPDEEDAEEQDSDASTASDPDDFPISGMRPPSQPAKHRPSTKIRHLLRILHAESPKYKTIVFSQFTSMLDLIEPYLKSSALRFVRYDGSMRPDAREASLHALRSDGKTRILLCSLKCGSLGLNLTAASRVVIVEPFWNPFVEEQAIDRVHRLNQAVDVKVFRLTVRGTVEERIVALQEKKRELADAAIEGGKAVEKLSMKDILGLFGRDAGDGHEGEDGAKWARLGASEGILSQGVTGFSTRDMVTSGERRGGREKARGVVDHDVYGRRW